MKNSTNYESIIFYILNEVSHPVFFEIVTTVTNFLPERKVNAIIITSLTITTLDPMHIQKIIFQRSLKIQFGYYKAGFKYRT